MTTYPDHALQWQRMQKHVKFILAHMEEFKLVQGDDGITPRSYTSGGKLVEVPNPIIRLSSLPGAQKRTVTVRTMKWGGCPHHHVTVREDDDFLWHAGEQNWYRPWDWEEGHGKTFNARYTRPQFVEPYVKRLMAEHFPPKTHVIEWERLGQTQQFVYGRSGD